MGFDAQAFARAGLAQRTQDVSVPDLAPWFGDDKPVWRVRGLTGNEVAKSRQAAETRSREAALAEALSSGTHAELVAELQHALGRSDSIEPDLARRMEMLVFGSVEPACALETAVRMADYFPTTFYALTNAILTLTGLGSEVGKKRTSSSATPASETA